MFLSWGILSYSNEPLKAILEVDQGIVEYYRWFIPKSLKFNRQMYSAHISVVRKEIPFVLDSWGKYEGQEFQFFYSNIIYFDEIYCWLNAYSEQLSKIRVELGLQPHRFDGGCFHITLGNKKEAQNDS